ncbi:MAG: PQQ-dependent sugar dehydrogenase, partial [Deltaproteobacteria bacterium]|nr:PQQ-dependent sugar dehydrogenase [Deltaproteobacteria bacterium]
MSHAALLRIDVEATDGPGGNYGIPSNPFVVGVTGDDEIWAFGVRNPWRIAFDTSTGDLSQDATQ